MSASVRVPTDERNIELGTVVNWRLIAAASGLAAAVVVAAVALALVAPAAPQKEPEVAQRRVAAAPDDDLIIPAQPQSQARPQPRPAPPPPLVVQAAPVPAAPEKPKPASKPVAVAPKRVPPHPSAPVVESKPVLTERANEAEATPAPSLKRRSSDGELELLERLVKDSHEVDIETEKGTTAKLLKEESSQKTQTAAPILELIAKRDDLRGLPMRKLADSQVPDKEVAPMKKFSLTVRGLTAKKRSRGADSGYLDMFYREEALVNHIDKQFKSAELRDDIGVRLLAQMLQPENVGVRLHMIRLWADTKGASAGGALAQRALFDLDPEVRLAATMALKDRPAAEYRSLLLNGLRHPWAPVADHAAEAIAGLNDRELVRDLVDLLDKPDPQAPTQNKDKKWVKPELVRINHLGNCVLCHAPCTVEDKTVLGIVPDREQPLPNESCYSGPKNRAVRADVTFLKQDFSVMQFIEKSGRWPHVQRFDYLVRQRELSATEVKRLAAEKEKGVADPPAYPQRDAVLWALRELTGKDLGERSAAWAEYLKKERETREP